MNIKPKRKMINKLGYFEDSGTDRKKYALLLAVYYDREETATKLIQSDPDQINKQDPHSGLTALHIAIFRQNRALVQLITDHTQTNVQLKDNFNRRAVDMLDYTADQEIFEAVMDATYPDDMKELEELAESELRKEQSQGNIVPLKPKNP